MVDLRKAIFDAQDIRTEVVEVPEWNVTVMLKALNGDERAIVMGSTMPNPQSPRLDYQAMYSRAFILGVCDPETKVQVFQPSDADAVMKKNGAVVERLALRIMSLSGMTQAGVEEARKN